MEQNIKEDKIFFDIETALFISLSLFSHCVVGVDALHKLVRASDSQCRSRNCPGFDPSILRHSGI
jgi:hypothetical protein